MQSRDTSAPDTDAGGDNDGFRQTGIVDFDHPADDGHDRDAAKIYWGMAAILYVGILLFTLLSS